MPNHKWSILLSLCMILSSSAQDNTEQCTYGPGYYCGSNIGKQADHLYYCDNGLWTDKETCQYGCFANKPGYPDYCFQSLNATASFPSSASTFIPTSLPSTSVPSPTNDILNAAASPITSSISLPTSLPTSSPSSMKNMTLIWEEAINTFIKDVISNSTHANNHQDEIIGNMRGIMGLERKPHSETV
ncbi:hypothetical protein BGW37DRAFT_471496 [Umbelopsis sp. PMI_123]|nr:hypothetical protein BGW37DRAFT_471496 [Umbelopsis sp. PMI_123]